METYQIIILLIIFAFAQAIYCTRTGYRKRDVAKDDLVAFTAILFVVWPIITLVLIFDALKGFITFLCTRGVK